MAAVFSGVYAAAVTPHRREGHEADFAAMLELVDYLARGRVQGICLLGSTGEFLHLKFADRSRLIYLAVKRSRVPIIAGVSHSTLDGALEIGSDAISSGAAGLLLMPPFFFRYGQEEVLEFYLRFARELGSPIPILLYNIPQFTTSIDIETARTLFSSGLYAGIKDSSGDPDYLKRLFALREQHAFTLLVGNDRLFTRARQAGADGVISGCACAVPELLAALENAITRKDDARIEALDGKLREFIDWIEKFPTPVGVKVATAARGLKVGPLAVPLAKANEETLAAFQKWFSAWLPSLKQVYAHA